MNISELAVEISQVEGGKVNLGITDIREVLRVMGDVMLVLEDDERKKLLKSISDAAAKRAKKAATKKKK